MSESEGRGRAAGGRLPQGRRAVKVFPMTGAAKGSSAPPSVTEASGELSSQRDQHHQGDAARGPWCSFRSGADSRSDDKDDIFAQSCERNRELFNHPGESHASFSVSTGL